MAYPKEFAHKLAHCPLIANASVRKTVAACAVAPSADPSTRPLPGIHAMEPAKELPDELKISAIDGSRWELNLDHRKHRFGYLQIGMVSFSLARRNYAVSGL